MIKVNIREKKLGSFFLRNIKFDLLPCENLLVLGPNGSGKSTLLKILAGILYPDDGEVQVLGYVPHQKKREFLSKISFVSPQKSRLIYDVSAMDNILLFGTAYGLTPKKIKSKAEYMAEILNIAHKLKQQVRTLSFGERVKIELISGFIHEPVLAFLDEPLIGLDFLTVENILKFFGSFKTQIIMTSHIFKELDKITNKILILNQGEQCFYGGWEILNKVYAEKRVIAVKTSNLQNLPPIFKRKGDNTYTATINADDSQKLYDELVKNIQIDSIEIREPEIEDILEFFIVKNGQD